MVLVVCGVTRGSVDGVWAVAAGGGQPVGRCLVGVRTRQLGHAWNAAWDKALRSCKVRRRWVGDASAAGLGSIGKLPTTLLSRKKGPKKRARVFHQRSPIISSLRLGLPRAGHYGRGPPILALG